MHKVDLHTHTTASDGQYTPAEVVRKAKEAGIEYLAITDHDTIDGVQDAMKAGREYGVRVMPGIELGAKEDRNMHILGYAFRPEDGTLQSLCTKLRQSRDERKYRIIDYLKSKDILLSLEEVERTAGGNVIARPHFAQVMLRHGYVSSMREVFDRYLDTEEYQKIERYKADAASCIQTIHQAGGMAVLAHPYQLGVSNEELEHIVVMLKSAGLDGLECYYPRHTDKMVQFYLALAQKYDLHVTAGSDFHGESVHADMPIRPVLIDISWLTNGNVFAL